MDRAVFDRMAELDRDHAVVHRAAANPRRVITRVVRPPKGRKSSKSGPGPGTTSRCSASSERRGERARRSCA